MQNSRKLRIVVEIIKLHTLINVRVEHGSEPSRIGNLVVTNIGGGSLQLSGSDMSVAANESHLRNL